MTRTLIDTRIWVLALKRGLYPEGSPLHAQAGEAQRVIEAALAHDTVLVSGQLVAEIFAVGTGRGERLRVDVVRAYLDRILSHPGVRFGSTRLDHYREAMVRSASSGIHIWDYLVVLPFQAGLDRIITMDPHFRHPSLADLGRVENPFGLWKVEGAK